MVTVILECKSYIPEDILLLRPPFFAQNRPASPEGLRKSFNISEKQFFQVALFSLCLQQKWSALDTLLTTKVSYLHPGCHEDLGLSSFFLYSPGCMSVPMCPSL